MSPGLAVRWTAREVRARGLRLTFFLACVALGVGAVVAVATVSAGIEDALRRDARDMLAADVLVSGRSPIPRAVREAAARLSGTEIAWTKEMASVAAAPAPDGSAARSALVQLKAVGGPYPLRGRLRLDPPASASALLKADGALAEPAALSALGVEVGDAILVGGEVFTVRGRVMDEPDRAGGRFALGPRILISDAGLARTQLEARGSRIDHRLGVRLPEGADPETAAEALRSALEGSPFHEVETWRDGQPAIREALARATRFLGLVALLSLVLGGIGVARTIHAWIASRTRSLAVLAALGLRPGELVRLYLGQALLLGLTGSLAGAALGTGAAVLAARWLADLLPVAEPSLLQPTAVLRGLALGLGVTALFAHAPLAELRRLPPLRALRADVEPPPLRPRAAALRFAVPWVGTVALAVAQSGSLVHGLGFGAGLAVAGGLLWLAATALRQALARAPRGRGLPWLRHALAALAHPAAGTTAATVALGLGVLAVVGTSEVEVQLRRQLLSALPQDAPTAFLLDVQQDQWPDVRRALTAEGASGVEAVPMIGARLAAIGGRSVEELAAAGAAGGRRDRRWALTREQRLTWLRELPEGNRVVAGALWSDPERWEVSVEQDFAADLGLDVGSELELDVQGVPVALAVTSLRSVEWRTFGINFFLVVEPGALEGAPAAILAAARLPPGGEQRVQDRIAAEHPNVAVIPVARVLERLARVLRLAGRGVAALGGLAVLAGLTILAGIVSAGASRKGRELALWKTLGATRGQLVACLLAEHGLVGLVAGLVGAAAAGGLSWAVLTWGMDLHGGPRPLVLAGWALACGGLTSAAGLVASLPALARRPIVVLRRG